MAPGVWLSLLRNLMLTLSLPTSATPKLVAGKSTQSWTSSVTSKTRYVPFSAAVTSTGPPPSEEPLRLGWALKVTVSSSQGPDVIRCTSTEPAANTSETKTIRVALLTLAPVMPPGRLRLQRRKPNSMLIPPCAWTRMIFPLPLAFNGAAASTHVSSVSVASTASAGAGHSIVRARRTAASHPVLLSIWFRTVAPW